MPIRQTRWFTSLISSKFRRYKRRLRKATQQLWSSNWDSHRCRVSKITIFLTFYKAMLSETVIISCQPFRTHLHSSRVSYQKTEQNWQWSSRARSCWLWTNSIRCSKESIMICRIRSLKWNLMHKMPSLWCRLQEEQRKPTVKTDLSSDLRQITSTASSPRTAIPWTRPSHDQLPVQAVKFCNNRFHRLAWRSSPCSNGNTILMNKLRTMPSI